MGFDGAHGGLLERKRDLLVSELASLHDMLLTLVEPSSCRSFCYQTVPNPGTGSIRRAGLDQLAQPNDGVLRLR
jgi:hypothetical protein